MCIRDSVGSEMCIRDRAQQPLDEQLVNEVQEILKPIHNWFYIEGRPENNDDA